MTEFSLYVGSEPPMDSTGSNVEPSAWDHGLTESQVMQRLHATIRVIPTLSNEELHIVVGTQNIMAMNLERESNDLAQGLADLAQGLADIRQEFDATESTLTDLENRVRDLEATA